MFPAGSTGVQQYKDLDEESVRPASLPTQFNPIQPNSTLKMFFSTLAEDELVHIFRRVKFPEPELLLSKYNPFAPVGHLFFDKLLVTSDSNIKMDSKQSKLIIGLRSNISVARDLLKLCGPSFKRVSLEQVAYFEGIEEFAELLSRFAKPRIELNLGLVSEAEVTMGVFMRHFSESTKSLKIRVFRTHNSLSLQCFIDIGNANLQSFFYHGTNLQRLNPLWEYVGDTLEEVFLVIHDDTGWKQCIEGIQTHCRKLTSIRLADPLGDSHVEESDVVNLLVSYGDQLLDAEFRFFGTKSCEVIAAQCKNVRCSAVNEGNQFTKISALHTRLKSLHLTLHDDADNDWSGLANAMKSCTSLGKMVVAKAGEPWVSISEECIRALFPKRMNNLNRFELDSVVDSKFLSHVARATSGLQSIRVACLALTSTSPFLAICRANLGLETIEVDEVAPNSVDLECSFGTVTALEEFIEAFMLCKSLRKIVLSLPRRSHPSIEQLRNLCVPFRHRLISFNFIFRKARFYSVGDGRSEMIFR